MFNSLFKNLAIFLIRFYQVAHHSFFSGSCRFHPTCSQYAIEALNQHGSLKGFFLAAKRILRCHPLGGKGYDPVPEKEILPEKGKLAEVKVG